MRTPLNSTRRRWARYNAKFGYNDPVTLASMNNLADVYATLRRHADAIKLQQETLTRRKGEGSGPTTQVR